MVSDMIKHEGQRIGRVGGIPGSGTGTILTSTRKSGPSLTTTPALHSLGISDSVIFAVAELV